VLTDHVEDMEAAEEDLEVMGEEEVMEDVMTARQEEEIIVQDDTMIVHHEEEDLLHLIADVEVHPQEEEALHQEEEALHLREEMIAVAQVRELQEKELLLDQDPLRLR